MIPEILKSALIGLSIFVLLILIAATGGGISSNGLLILVLLAFGAAYLRHRLRRGRAKPPK